MKKMTDFSNLGNPPKAVGGIDTLYYFADITGDNYNKIYYEKIVNGEFFDGFEFLGYSGKNTGFVGSWFKYSIPTNIKVNGKILDVTLFRVGFKNPDKQKNVKNVYIQLYAEGIYYYGLEDLLQFIDELFSSYGLISNGYYVSRADINIFTNYDFSNIQKEMFKVPSRSTEVTYGGSDDKFTVYTTDRLETIYFGSRSSDIFLKIYDKGRELLQGRDKSYHKFFLMNSYLKENGLDTDCLWNIEFSLKRKGLLSYGVNTIEHLLQKAGSIFKDLMTKYLFLGYDVEKIENYRKMKHLSRLSAYWVWDYLRNAYNRFDVVPVKREIKKYCSNTIDKLIERIAVNISDVEYNADISFDDVVQLVLLYRRKFLCCSAAEPDL